jgi:hypothetical protein
MILDPAGAAGSPAGRRAPGLAVGLAGRVARLAAGPRLGNAALLCGVGLVTAGAAALARGGPWLAAAPVALCALLWVLWTVPLRWSVTASLFLVLSLDQTGDAMGVWRSPAGVLGDLLKENLDKIFVGSGLKLSGFELLTLLLYAVAFWRRAHGDAKDTRGQEQTAGVLRGANLVFLAGLAYATVLGLATGGSTKFAIVQLRPLLHLPALYLLFHLTYRGAADHLTLAKLILVTATLKAGLAVWVDRNIAPYAMMRKWEFSTSHGDSILFAVAMLVVITHLMERPDRRRLIQAALWLPPIAWGTLHNHRRLAYLAMGTALLCIYAISPWSGWKRRFTRAGLVLVPAVALYLAVGWTSPQSAIFAPVRMLRTVSDAKVDRSTLYRDVENWNLASSIQEAPVLGRGFGHPFTEYIKGDDISRVFELYAIEPHNAVLGLLLFGGLFGFTTMWGLLGVGIYLAARAYRHAVVPEDRAAALTAMSAVVICAVLTFGDMGQVYSQYQVLLPLALVVAGKLAVRTGAWPAAPVPVHPPSMDHGWRSRWAARLHLAESMARSATGGPSEPGEARP